MRKGFLFCKSFKLQFIFFILHFSRLCSQSISELSLCIGQAHPKIAESDQMQDTEIRVFAWGKQGLKCLLYWCLALTIRLLTGWGWFSVADVISLLISHLPPLGESGGDSVPVAGTPAEPSAADACPCPSKQQSCWALLLLGWMSLEGGGGGVWLLFWLEILSLQAMHMLLWKVLLLTNIFLAKMLICRLWHFSAFHKCSKLQQTAMLYVTACIGTPCPPAKEFSSSCPLHY